MIDLQNWLQHNLRKLNNVDEMYDPHAFSRLGFTEEEAVSHRQFLAIADELGLKISRDKAGNNWAIWEVDHTAPTIAMGSHLDTVYEGGGYDGVSGVLCALAVIKILKAQSFRPTKNIAVICFIAEESARFGVSSIGSKALSGEINYAEMEDVTDKDGITIKQAVEQMGIHWKDLGNRALLEQGELEQFLEVHIEQGKVLEENESQIGIVTKIARPTRLLVTVDGELNHTGTTPMHMRNDALVAAAPLVSYIHNEAREINEYEDPSLVATVSTIDAEPNSMTTIPGEVQMGIDIRSVEAASKKKMVENIYQFCSHIEKEHQTNVRLQTLVDNDPVALDDTMRNKLWETSRHLGFQTEKMPSGAGHDAMNMAKRWPTGMIFIPCRDGVSHHPAEYTKIQHLKNATDVLVSYIQSEA